MPYAKDPLKMIDRGKARAAWRLCQKQPGRPSGPGAEAGLIDLRCLETFRTEKSGVMLVGTQ
jgi:hypothetical protein